MKRWKAKRRSYCSHRPPRLSNIEKRRDAPFFYCDISTFFFFRFPLAFISWNYASSSGSLCSCFRCWVMWNIHSGRSSALMDKWGLIRIKALTNSDAGPWFRKQQLYRLDDKVSARKARILCSSCRYPVVVYIFWGLMGIKQEQQRILRGWLSEM